jgi:hypothetical protein
MNKEETLEMLREMEKEKKGGGKKFWSPDSKFEGSKHIRFLPPLKKLNEKVFYFKHKIHWINRIPYESLDQTVYDSSGKLVHEAQKDPVQSFVRSLYNSSQRDSDDWKLASSLNESTRYLSRIVIRDKENPENELKPVFYEYGPTVFDLVFHILTESDYGNIIDPKTGRDFVLTKKGTGRSSKYNESLPAANTSMLFDDIEKIKTVFGEAEKMDYSSLLSFPSYEEKKEALNEFLGVSTKPTYSVPSKPFEKTEEKEEEFSSNNLSGDGDENIDDILSEFTS